MSTNYVNGLAVEIDGEGPALLCIHGLGGSSNTWTPVMGAFEGLRVIRPDLPGSARSPLGSQPLSIQTYVDALAGMLAELKIDTLHIAAHSLGTIVAQHFAVAHPGRVRSLALFGPLAAPPDAGRAGIRARAELARGGDAAMQEIADAIVKGATSARTRQDQPAVLALVRESVMRQPPEGYAQSCEALAGAQPAAVESLDVPALLVTGDQDGVAPPANVEALAGRIAASRYVVFGDCGHWTTYEQPQACVQALREFYAAQR
ncbi:alpha/beta hydrolase [Achromobacter sp. HZ01]|jgi:pimeloyl-ACP methyl ester carboxylesterase|uniref:Alpha/beta hydrolase n=1 Tax=Achromobacter pulmonis TaxID=1389932 RepID=A0A2N8KLA0_9BURK|nr:MULTISPECIES: alpha/beta fold hydrolase [Achromobacter]PND34233.1 alpha/beta hydrolase [Achromobacter pulmonis]RAP64674.1 alpha/beta hydrolase [Achromobacter sp. HZ01]